MPSFRIVALRIWFNRRRDQATTEKMPPVDFAFGGPADSVEFAFGGGSQTLLWTLHMSSAIFFAMSIGESR